VIIKYPELVDLMFNPTHKLTAEEEQQEKEEKEKEEKEEKTRLKAEKKRRKQLNVGPSEYDKREEELRSKQRVKAKLASMDHGRLPKTWKATLVSNRLVMFHALFIRLFRTDEFKQPLTPLQTKQRLDRCFGRSTHTMQNTLQRAIKRIKEADDWELYFTRLGLPFPTIEFLSEWLRQAAVNSQRKGYHNPRAVREALEQKREEARKEREKKMKKLKMLFDDMVDEEGSESSQGVFNKASRSAYFDDGPGHKYASSKDSRY